MTEKTPKASPSPSAVDHEHSRTGTSPAALKAAFLDNLNYVVGRPLDLSSAEDR